MQFSLYNTDPKAPSRIWAPSDEEEEAAAADLPASPVVWTRSPITCRRLYVGVGTAACAFIRAVCSVPLDPVATIVLPDISARGNRLGCHGLDQSCDVFELFPVPASPSTQGRKVDVAVLCQYEGERIADDSLPLVAEAISALGSWDEMVIYGTMTQARLQPDLDQPTSCYSICTPQWRDEHGGQLSSSVPIAAPSLVDGVVAALMTEAVGLHRSAVAVMAVTSDLGNVMQWLATHEELIGQCIDAAAKQELSRTSVMYARLRDHAKSIYV